jgi:hypothetical protein
VHEALKVPNTFAAIQFPLALQNPELFNAIIALSQNTIDLYTNTEQTSQVLYYRGNALAKLRDKLNAPGAIADDAAILTTLVLMGVDVRFLCYGPNLLELTRSYPP